jgi:hypothetical protein
MRRLMKICLAAALTALAALVGRRLLDLEQERAMPQPVSRSNGTRATRDELYREARELQVEGRSKMNKGQLREAVEAARTGGSA